MEFFGEVETPGLTPDDLKNRLTIAGMPELCRSISSVISDEKEKGVICCIWGEFEINREVLKYGVRFSMPECPNALTWAITADGGSDRTVIHCTINKTEHDEDFIESIRDFINDWTVGIKGTLDPHAPMGVKPPPKFPPMGRGPVTLRVR